MPRRSVNKTRILTAKQLKFIACWQGSSVAAAAAAGCRDPRNSAAKFMRLEPVRDAIRRKQNAMAEEAGKILGKKIAICRADIINRLWDLAIMSHEETKSNITGQVRAATALAHIFDTKRKPDASQLEAKTEEDLSFFAIHGYFPSEQEEHDKAEESPLPELLLPSKKLQ